FHPSGQWVASGGGDQKEILLWHAGTGEILSRLEGGGRTIWAVGFSKDGRYVSWGHTSDYTSPNDRGPLEHRFDLTQLVRLAGDLPSASARRAQERVGRLALSVERGGPYDYDYRLIIRRGGTRLSTITRGLTDGCRHSAYTITRDGQGVLSGGLNGELRFYALDGKTRATLIGHTGEIKAVALSTDGCWAVSGSVDQTLKLWSLAGLPEAGEVALMPSLTLFPSADGEWVAWTPEGFFTASAHGTTLMGYSINQGVDKVAVYVSVDQLFDRFYRPDLILAHLQGDPHGLWHQEGAKTDVYTVLARGLPPRVTFVSQPVEPTLAEGDIAVRVELTDRGGGIGKVVWKLNGVTIASDTNAGRGLDNTAVSRGFPSTLLRKLITLLPGTNRLEVIASTKDNDVVSPPAVLPYTRTNPDSTSESDLYVLAVGINRYEKKTLLPLEYAMADAQAIAKNLPIYSRQIFRHITVTEVLDEQATLAKIEAAFTEIATQAKASDVFILHLAGHGVAQDGRYYFLPQDFRDLSDNAIDQDRLQRLLAGIRAHKSMVLIDTCDSGTFVKAGSNLREKMQQTVIDKLARATGRATLAATIAQQFALEGHEGHGVFTYVILQALQQADASFGMGTDGPALLN
ncbi:MAG: caspase family protein, partial [Hyphomicrobium sp.]